MEARLHQAAENGEIGTVRKILKNLPKVDVNDQDDYLHSTPLLKACKCMSKDYLMMLLLIFWILLYIFVIELECRGSWNPLKRNAHIFTDTVQGWSVCIASWIQQFQIKAELHAGIEKQRSSSPDHDQNQHQQTWRGASFFPATWQTKVPAWSPFSKPKHAGEVEYYR